MSPLWQFVHAVGIGRLGWSLCGVAVLLLFIASELVRQADKSEVTAAIDSSLSIDAQGYAKFIGLTLAIVDRELIERRQRYLQGMPLPAQEEINTKYKELNGLVMQISTTDAQGELVESSLGVPEYAVSIEDRPHFRLFKAGLADELFISAPILGRVSRRPSLQLVRPLMGTDGVFRGVIVASIDAELLKNYFANLKVLDKQGELTIVGKDGVPRFRLTSRGFNATRTTPAWPYPKQQSGLFSETSATDGVYRRVAYQEVDGLPLVVAVGTGIHAQFEDFELRWKLAGGLGLVLAALLALLTSKIIQLAREQVRSYELLRISRNRARESDLLKSSYLASVSHELRGPLENIIEFSERIQETGSDANAVQHAGEILCSGSHLNSLINTILDLAQIEAGEMGMKLETIHLPQLLKTIRTIHAVRAEEKKLALVLSIPEDIDIRYTVETDRGKLIQILNNVLRNAIKFTPAGSVHLIMKPVDKRGLLISVIDTGIGIQAANIDKVFERFNTVANMDEEGHEKGTGLSLALSRDLLTLMGGRIDLYSEVGHGTTVDIFIPYQIKVWRNSR